MSLVLKNNESEKFEEKLNEALNNKLLTKNQKDALLAKYNRKFDGEKLSDQNRNALRILRNILVHNQQTSLKYSKNIIRYELLQYFLAMVDDTKGMYCHVCKEGFLLNRTISKWIYDTRYELILEQKPAQVCIKKSCKTTTSNIETDEKEEEIIIAVEKQLRTIRTIKPEDLKTKKCPLCRSNSMKRGQTGETYRYRQGLYHIKIKDIGKNVSNELEKLEELLDEKVRDLLNAKY